MRTAGAALLLAVTAVVAVGCGNGDDAGTDDAFVADIRPAIAAVEAELGPGQEFFEITATPRLTNLFVAVDEATTAVPYVFLDGELQPPAPALTGAAGFTFTAEAVEFDEAAILGEVADQLPDATIEALSIEGGRGGVVRYVVSTRSVAGGRLDVTVGPGGDVLEVDPV